MVIGYSRLRTLYYLAVSMTFCGLADLTAIAFLVQKLSSTSFLMHRHPLRFKEFISGLPMTYLGTWPRRSKEKVGPTRPVQAGQTGCARDSHFLKIWILHEAHLTAESVDEDAPGWCARRPTRSTDTTAMCIDSDQLHKEKRNRKRPSSPQSANVWRKSARRTFILIHRLPSCCFS